MQTNFLARNIRLATIIFVSLILLLAFWIYRNTEMDTTVRVNPFQVSLGEAGEARVKSCYSKPQRISESSIHSLLGTKLVELDYEFWGYPNDSSILSDNPNVLENYEALFETIVIPTKEGREYKFEVENGIIKAILPGAAGGRKQL